MNNKQILLSYLILSSSVFAADSIVDLGTLTSRKGLTLSHNITDFDHYRLELLDGTNKVNLNITNNLIKLRDLGQISSTNKVTMGVITVTKDGDESEAALYQFSVRNTKPHKPIVMETFLYESNNFGWLNSQTHTNGIPPLPNGSPETYPEYVEKMLRFYSDMHMRMNNGTNINR